MKVLLFLASFLLVAHAFSISDADMEEWKAYKIKFNKFYSEAEDNYRMKIYMDKKREIAEHNARYEKGEVTYTIGLNQFSDKLHDEFVKKYNVYDGAFEKTRGSTFIAPENVEIPDEVDWVKEGAVTRVKDEGNCSVSYAFSATGAIEGQHFRKTGKLVSLSEQNLLDCNHKDNFGCLGGLTTSAFEYVIRNKGIDTEESYPYVAKFGRCEFDPKNIGATITGYVNVPKRNETALKVAVATVGPVSVFIWAMGSSFRDYSGGVYSDPNCATTMMNQPLLAVGYGTDKATNKKYWLLKHSWGESWGEKGYMRLERDAGNMCAIATMASYPTINM